MPPRGRGGPPHRRNREDRDGPAILYGWHTVTLALANPKRKVLRAVTTERAAQEIGAKLLGRVKHEIADMKAVDRLLPDGAVHQGAALQCEKLPKLDLEELLDQPSEKRRIVVVLDQISDPHNEGAILRSAAAFGASAVVVQDRHAPRFTGALAKAAAGAVERTPVARVTNLSRALETLVELGWRTVGLTGAAERGLAQVLDGAPVVLVLGSEGEGLRRLVAEHCDELAKIPMPGSMESLNVSVATGVALFEALRQRGAKR